MNALLIGSSGFVGSNLIASHNFQNTANSKNIDEYSGKSYDLVVCAAPQAKKWLANKDPNFDLIQINKLINSIKKISAKKFILISTVDIYSHPIDCDESTNSNDEIHYYGKHRRVLEESIRNFFGDKLIIIRLPALIGKNLQKNVIFDLQNNNEIYKINFYSKYQWYNLKNLYSDISRAIELNLPILNITSEPIFTWEIISRFFPEFNKNDFNLNTDTAVSYDVRSIHFKDWKGMNGYLYSKTDILNLHFADYFGI